MAVPIICDRTRTRRICPDCGVDPIGRPQAKRCVECTDKVLSGQLRPRTSQPAPRNIAASIARSVDRDRELERRNQIALRGK